MQGSSVLPERAGPRRIDLRDLTPVVRAATGLPDAEPTQWRVEPVDYPVRSWVTAELARVRGTAVDGAIPGAAPVAWSVFVKTLRSPHQLRLPDGLPAGPRVRAQALATRDATWRHEADVYRAELDDLLPAGLRFPGRYRIHQPTDDRIVEWLEDVSVADVEWDRARFARAATLLGRLAVRLTRSARRLPPSVTRVPGEVLRHQFLERELFALPALASEQTWAHPLLATDRSLRADLGRLAERVPALLDALDGLPQTFGHGDACPQNLLVPAEAPDTFVAVDWSLLGPAAVGYDLGQLLLGLAHTGQLDLDVVPGVQEAIQTGYLDGLAAEGMPVAEGVVRFGFHAALVVRSAFSALPLHRLTEPITDELATLVTRRVELTRYLVDLGLALRTRP
jgi:hypothetical protein